MFKLNLFKKYSETDKKIISSNVIGNLLDSYDVMICAFLAPVLALVFFPESSLKNSTLNIFIIFFLSNLSRPIGSIISGLFADQIGRKKVLILSLFFVGFGTIMIGLIPPYQSIGIFSYILFLVFRIMQNISAGSEYISSIVYVTENAGIKRRGFFGSWIAFGYNLGTLIASLLVFIVMYLIENKIIPDWSWRLIFFTAIIGMITGLRIRLSLPESMEFILENANNTNNNRNKILKDSFNLLKKYPSPCFSIFGITWLGVCVTFSVFVYSPIHISTVNYFSFNEALGINLISLFFLIVFIPFFGLLSDRYDRVTMLKLTSLSFIVLAIPCYWYLSYGNLVQILMVKILFSIPSACFFSVAPVLIVETLPTKIRCTATALLYQVPSSLAGGLTPLIVYFLIENTEHAYSPGYFLILSSILGLLSLYAFKPIKDDAHILKKVGNETV